MVVESEFLLEDGRCVAMLYKDRLDGSDAVLLCVVTGSSP